MRSKIIILAIFVFLVSLLITLNVIFHESLRDELAIQHNKQQLLIAKTIADSINSTITHLVVETISVAKLLAEKGVYKDEGIKAFIASSFEKAEFNLDIIFTVFNKAGEAVFTSVQDPVPLKDFSNLLQLNERLPEGEVYFFEDMLRDDMKLRMTTPVRKDGKLLGLILITININTISEKFLSPIKSGDRGYAWMMDGSGTLIFHPTQPGMVGNNLYHADEKCFGCHESFELEKKVLEGDVEFGRYIAPSREDKVLAFSKVNIGKTSWIICISSPYTEVISITERSMKLYSWLVVAIFATVFLGASVVILINRRRMKTEKEAKEAVLLEKQKLDTIVSAIGSGLMLLDKDHKILWINKTLREWAGNVEGFDCGVVFPVKAKYEDLPGDIFHDTFADLFGRKGRTFDVTSAPVKDKDGYIIGVLKLIQDVTEVKKLEAGIMHSEKLAALGRLAAGVAHEIGNPLTSISSFAQILKSKADDDFTKESLDTIYHHIMRISGIVSQMSRLSKLPEMDLRHCNINHLIESTLDIVKYDNKLKDIRIIKELSVGIPSVYVDENYLVQVFINLMLNAADAIPDGKGTITVRSMRENNSVIVQYMDSGMGIPADALNKIFDPFFTTKEKGTGLGLSISYEIIKRFGGELKADSQEGMGSVFSVNLPAGDIEDE
ncbi:MAG: Cache 3/Cache 2 fusion domain-containing protein [Nitrospirae bacterium]|nr:Cache 3/Cache 2 fusion domain-containing protein [Nitrospirota bacterium]